MAAMAAGSGRGRRQRSSTVTLGIVTGDAIVLGSTGTGG